MLIYFRRFLRSVLAFALLWVPMLAWSQAYPSKPVRWVVSYPPGGGTDFLARTLGAQMGKQMGEAFVIENRPGGAGFIAAESVARAPGDGYTVFSGDNGTLVYNTALFRKTPYDPVKDFAPVGMMARFPLVLLAAPNAPFTSAAQLVETSRKKPGALNYGSPGLGSPHHLAMELLKQRAHLYIVHVPYRGSPAALQDLMGGELGLFVADSAAALPLVRSGKVRALAVFSRARMSALPDVPTWIELGFQGVEAYGWQALVVPAGTPRDIASRLSSEMVKAIRTPEISAKLTDFGLELVPSDPSGLSRYLSDEIRLWHELIRERRIRLD